MRTPIAPGNRLTHRTAFATAILNLLIATLAGAEEQGPARDHPQAPGDSLIVESDLAGSYFVARPLKEKYDELVKRVGELKAEIDDARIDEAGARRELDRLQGEIDEAIRAIEKARVYVPGATIENRATVQSIPLGPGDLLLVDAADVEIRGGEGPEVKCVLKKTALGELGREQDLAPEFDGIELVVRRSSGREKFEFYRTAAEQPALRHEYERFPFKPFLEREFTVVTIKGLTHDEGNRMISVGVKNEAGIAHYSNAWRRHAKLLLTVPKCQGVGVQGLSVGLRVHGLNSSLMVQANGGGGGDKRFEVTGLGGSLTASDIAFNQVADVQGDVSILATAYTTDVSISHGPDGATMRPSPPRPASYKDIRGNLLARLCRADLTLEKIAGRVDVENAFGRTVWRAKEPIAARDHRIVSQSGPIEVRLAPTALGRLPLALFTECGTIRLPAGESNSGLKSRMFHGSMGDVTNRSWNGFVTSEGNDRPDGPLDTLFPRIPTAFRGEGRTPGIDIISRAGTITYEPMAGAARNP
jgi:hypothetical protein